MRDPEPADVIDPRRLYSFSEAARLIPSPRCGTHTAAKTLHHWRQEGLLQAECRQSRGKRYWFIRGAEILRLLGGPREFVGATPAQRRRSKERALKDLRAKGFRI